MEYRSVAVAYPELRVAYETMQKESREVIIGGPHIINPDTYLMDVGALNTSRGV